MYCHLHNYIVYGRWFSPGTPASSTTKTGRHDIAEILLKVALSTQKINQSINLTWIRVCSNQMSRYWCILHFTMLCCLDEIYNYSIWHQRWNKKRLINIIRLANTYEQEYCWAIIALYVFTRCDNTGAFRGIGKVKLIYILQRESQFLHVFSELDVVVIVCSPFLSALKLWVRIMLRQGVLNTTLCDKVCQWLVASSWFSMGTLVSSTNKTDRHDIAEILLKVALSI